MPSPEESSLESQRKLPVEEWTTREMTLLKELEARQREEYSSSEEAKAELERWKMTPPSPTWEWDSEPPVQVDTPIDFLD